MKKNTSERAVDTVGKPKFSQKSEGSSAGTAKNLSKGGSTQGIGGLRAQAMVDEPVKHEPAYRRGGGDKNYEAKTETGTPRQEASYTNRDRQGSGLETQPMWQNKVKSYPSKSPKISK